MNKKFVVVLIAAGALGMFTLSNQAVQPDVTFSVTVPFGTTPTMHDESDSGDVRLEVYSVGDDIYYYNFPAHYGVLSRAGSINDPDIYVCNSSGENKTFQFYQCGAPGEGTIEVLLQDGECFNTDSYNCAVECETTSECPYDG